jgi:hypothetical protein
MPTKDEVLSWLRKYRPLSVGFGEHLNAARIEIGFGFAFWVSLIFVVVQFGNA